MEFDGMEIPDDIEVTVWGSNEHRLCNVCRAECDPEPSGADGYTLGELLGHDPHFAHGFSRNPFYTGKSPSAYRWYRQHNRVMRLGDLIRQVRDLAGTDQYEA